MTSETKFSHVRPMGYRKCSTEGCEGDAGATKSGAAKGFCAACYRRQKRGSKSVRPARKNGGYKNYGTTIGIHAWDALLEHATRQKFFSQEDGQPAINQALRDVLKTELPKYQTKELPTPKVKEPYDFKVDSRLDLPEWQFINAYGERDVMSDRKVGRLVVTAWAATQKTKAIHEACTYCAALRGK